MRRTVKVLTLGLVVVMAAPLPASADVVVARSKVFDDPTADQPLLVEATPPAQDLVAGFIEETTDALIFTWRVVDFPDGTGGLPEVLHFYWEFSIDPDGAGPQSPVAFSLRARAPTPGGLRGTGGSLQRNCMRTQNVVSCQPVPDAVVTVTVDDLANEITAVVRKRDVWSTDPSVSLAVPGAVLTEAPVDQVFIGIASVPGALVISSALADTADPNPDCDQFVLGSGCVPAE